MLLLFSVLYCERAPLHPRGNTYCQIRNPLLRTLPHYVRREHHLNCHYCSFYFFSFDGIAALARRKHRSQTHVPSKLNRMFVSRKVCLWERRWRTPRLLYSSRRKRLDHLSRTQKSLSWMTRIPSANPSPARAFPLRFHRYPLQSAE